ncbi:MAG: PH domain-containing protein [Candidatus Pacebacteria bacterium]|nr:PH domain-containing protein [Candidatus Paceibacterota bacterium]
MQLNPSENIIHVFRKHWFVIFSEALLFIVIFMLPIILITIGITATGVMISPIVQAMLQVLGLGWLLLLWIGFSIVYTDYYLDVWVLTNQRLVDIEQQGLFTREIATLGLDKIQDVTTKQSGIFPTILNFGDVHLQSAGGEREFIIHYVHDPKHVRDLLMHEQENKSREVQKVQIVT